MARRPWVENLEGRALLASTGLDSTFGQGGVIFGPLNDGSQLSVVNNAVDALAVQSDGKIVEVETQSVPASGTTTTSPLVVRRFNADGSVDTAFGTNGVTSVPLGSPFNAILTASRELAITPDGGIVFTANAYELNAPTGSTAQSESLIVKLTSNGQLDSGFGVSGEYVLPSTFSGFTTVAVQSDGKILAAGVLTPSTGSVLSSSQIAVLRLTTAGQLDTSFNQSGLQAFTLPNSASVPNISSKSVMPVTLKLGSTGQITLASDVDSVGLGVSTATTTSELTRINTDGTLDSTFGTAGTLTPSINVNDLAVQADGKLVLAGVLPEISPTNKYSLIFFPALTRLATDGTTDSSFTGITTATTSRFATISRLALGTDGTINIVGSQSNGVGLVERFTTSGVVDPTFGTRGVAAFTINSPMITNSPYRTYNALAVTASGNLLIGGGVGQIDVANSINLSQSFLAQVSATTTASQTVANDYDGDGISDVAAEITALGLFAYRKSTGGDVLQGFGVGGVGQTIPAPGDYDGDGKTDVAAYFPALGEFGIRYSSGLPDKLIPFGIPGAGQSIPAPSDYDGDGKTDLAVYLPTLGVLGIRPSSGGADELIAFGIPGSGQTIPAPGDYDGDGITDLAVYLPALGDFGIRPSSGTGDELIPFGLAGAGGSIPAPGDYDGDGKTDIAAFLPPLGLYAYRPSSGGSDVVEAFGGIGLGGTVPAPGDYDGDGKTDVAAYLPAIRLLRLSPLKRRHRRPPAVRHQRHGSNRPGGVDPRRPASGGDQHQHHRRARLGGGERPVDCGCPGADGGRQEEVAQTGLSLGNFTNPVRRREPAVLVTPSVRRFD